MAGLQVPLVLIARFSTYLGPEFYRGLPLDVTAFSGLTLSMWSGPQHGTTPTVTLTMEGSVDRVTWGPINSPWPLLPGVETQQSVDVEYPWIRSFLSVQGLHSAVTCWAAGFLIKRER